MEHVKELNWTEEGQFRFLDGESLNGNMVALQSFPRSGSTFLRCYLEAITDITTGSDSNIEDSFNLAMMGMKGQNTVSDSNKVWITATNYPLQPENAFIFNAQKMICIVRNPLETIASNAYEYALRGHNLRPE